ncbi:hypothetical protein [Hymenobacter gummosus]|uniref:hypothetical protein n=1 Tax=Hymenobacter gummosus TaxID=1776032 RepID=UPI001405285E|nr:hypothetical protein [Hymenobacter gummosus]
MYSRLMLAGLLLPCAATAQHLDLGLTGGARTNYTAVADLQGIQPSGRGAAGMAGAELSYTWAAQPFRLALGAQLGQLVTALPLRGVGATEPVTQLRLSVRQLQVPLRLHTRLLQLGPAWAVHLLTGAAMHLHAAARPKLGGDYQTDTEPYREPFYIHQPGQPDEPYRVSVTNPYLVNWVLENGLVASYAPGPRLGLDLAAVYQAGLRPAQTVLVTTPGSRAAPPVEVGRGRNEGKALLLTLTARYALKNWGGGS